MEDLEGDYLTDERERRIEEQTEHFIPIFDEASRALGDSCSPDQIRILARDWAEEIDGMTDEEMEAHSARCEAAQVVLDDQRDETLAAVDACFAVTWKVDPAAIRSMTEAYLEWFEFAVRVKHRWDEEQGNPHSCAEHSVWLPRAIETLEAIKARLPEDGGLSGLAPDRVSAKLRRSIGHPNAFLQEVAEREEHQVVFHAMIAIERDILARPRGDWFDGAIELKLNVLRPKYTEIPAILRCWATSLGYDAAGPQNPIPSPGKLPNGLDDPDVDGWREQPMLDENGIPEFGPGHLLFDKDFKRGTALRTIMLLNFLLGDHLPTEVIWLAAVEGEWRQLMGSQANRLAGLIERRFAFLTAYVPPIEIAEGRLQDEDMLDPQDYVQSEELLLFRGILLRRYREARGEVRSLLDAGCTPNVAAAKVSERREAFDAIWGPQLAKDDVIRRFSSQTDRLGIQHELEGHPLDIDGNPFCSGEGR